MYMYKILRIKKNKRSIYFISLFLTAQYRKFKSRLKDKLEKCKTDCEPQMFIKIQQKVKVKVLKFEDRC